MDLIKVEGFVIIFTIVIEYSKAVFSFKIKTILMKMCSLYSTYPPEHSEHIFNDIISVLNEKTAFEYSMITVKMMTNPSTLIQIYLYYTEIFKHQYRCEKKYRFCKMPYRFLKGNTEMKQNTENIQIFYIRY